MPMPVTTTTTATPRWEHQLAAAISDPATPTTLIKGLWLRREGEADDPLATFVLLVELPDGTFKRVIEVGRDEALSQYVSAAGIRLAPVVDLKA
jgi:hypothetical protein